MKNGFLKIVSQSFAASVFVIAAQGAHSEGLLVSPAITAEFSPAVASGRAVLKTRDLQNLLHASAGNPSASTKVAPSSFLMDLSADEKVRLSGMIDRISRERTLLEEKLQKIADKKILTIRNRRHDIQSRRLSSFGASEHNLSKQLFETIVEESNVASEMKQELEQFDNSHLVHLDFVEFKGTRVVQSISLGASQLWAVQKAINVAQAK